MKPHTTRRMKIEPFPWLRDYFVDMRKLYSKLTLEKINNTLFGEKCSNIENYEKMFDPDSDSEDESSERNKILMKGEPGMGKTTLGKKIGWDWSRDLFKKFSIVFFIFLKFVKPEDSIEDIILQQHTELQGLNVTKRKLRAMLEKFGDRCLLILDGLDEHGLGQNEDVLKMIRNEKLIDCGLVVSSRPHSINEVLVYFPTIIRVDGFNEKEAERFISNFFTDKTKIAQIMQFKPSDSREEFPVHKCPILLSFLCLLVSENEIDLLSKNLMIGDLYLRMIKCLFKKYTIRKGTQFTQTGFLKVMKSVGRLAMHTLISNKPLLQKSEVLRIVGDFAFEYGFFAGHEDFRLCSDPEADMYVTYGHRSLEEFFGSFGFIQALEDGNSINDIICTDSRKSIFLANPLILRFCLWLLTTNIFNFAKNIHDELALYFANRIDGHTLELEVVEKVYASINIGELSVENDSLKKEFFKHVLEYCNKVRILRIECVYHRALEASQRFMNICGVLGLMNPSLYDKLTMLTIGNYIPSDINSEAFTISLDSPDFLDILLKKYNLFKRNPEVYLKFSGTGTWDLMSLIPKNIKELCLFSRDKSSILHEPGEFPYCPKFTHFFCTQLEN